MAPAVGGIGLVVTGRAMASLVIIEQSTRAAFRFVQAWRMSEASQSSRAETDAASEVPLTPDS